MDVLALLQAPLK